MVRLWFFSQTVFEFPRDFYQKVSMILSLHLSYFLENKPAETLWNKNKQLRMRKQKHQTRRGAKAASAATARTVVVVGAVEGTEGTVQGNSSRTVYSIKQFKRFEWFKP